jgi:hypothetical protein
MIYSHLRILSPLQRVALILIPLDFALFHRSRGAHMHFSVASRPNFAVLNMIVNQLNSIIGNSEPSSLVAVLLLSK